MNTIEGFADLFEGRTDAFGSDGTLNRGLCIRNCPPPYREHLSGLSNPIGVYPMMWRDGSLYRDDTGRWAVKWGCVDFDRKSDGHKSYDYETEAECHTAAVNLQNALSAFGVTSWIERTRSCGRHVWVFSAGWVTAMTMRRALLVATSVVGCSQREVNPKSETLDQGQLGNYVRLPYPGGLNLSQPTTTRQILDVADIPYSLGVFVDAALVCRTPPAILEGIAKLYVPPPKTSIAPLGDDVPLTYVEHDLVERMLPYTRARFEEDLPDDRSAALASIAGSLSKQKLEPFTPAEILAVLYLADDRWQKYVGRRDRHDRLSEIVERAVSR